MKKIVWFVLYNFYWKWLKLNSFLKYHPQVQNPAFMHTNFPHSSISSSTNLLLNFFVSTIYSFSLEV